MKKMMSGFLARRELLKKEKRLACQLRRKRLNMGEILLED